MNMKKLLALISLLAISLAFSACGEAAKPELPGADADRNANAALFTYAEYGAGLEVIGVRAGAASLTSLTIPAEYEGKAVVAVGASAFKEAPVLEQVNIYDNVSAIANGAFAECPTLKFVVLYATPSAVSVSYTGLLEGSAKGLAIWVPSSAYSDFTTNYYWGPYSGSMKSFD